MPRSKPQRGLLDLFVQERIYAALVHLSLLTQDPGGWVEPQELVDFLRQEESAGAEPLALHLVDRAVNELRRRHLVAVELRFGGPRHSVQDLYRPALTEARLAASPRRPSALAD